MAHHLGPAERQQPILLRVATTPKPLMRDAEVKDQAPAASLVSQVVPDFHIAAPLACAETAADLVSKRGGPVVALEFAHTEFVGHVLNKFAFV
jgi:hypothetical protein